MARRGWQVSFEADRERAEREAAGDGDRSCARGELCAGASRERLDDGTVQRTPARSYQPVCTADRSILADCIWAAPATYRRLSAAIGIHVVADSVGRTPFGPSVPLRCDIDMLMRGLVDACMSWLERVAAVARLSCPPTETWRRRSLNGHAVTLVEEAAPVLRAHVDAVLALPAEAMMRPACSPAARTAEALGAWGDYALLVSDGGTAALEFLALDHAARSALLETPAPVVQLLGVPCRECSRRSLRLAPPKQHDGDADVYSVCSLCRDAMPEPDYRAWSKAWAGYYGSMMTPAQMAAAS